MPAVTIDGTTVEVEKEQTILDAAQKAGIWIPTLCFHKALSTSGSCRLCMVELDRGDWKQLVTACNYPVRKDISVSVSSDRAQKARKGVMQLMLARSPDSDELKELAEKMGVTSTPYPTVTESQRGCILCGLCTAVCEEIIGKSAISFAGRGVERNVTPPFGTASNACIACGACAEVCPVGTIKIRIHEDTNEVEISPFKSRAPLIVCEECGENVISEPVAEEMFSLTEIDWEEFRKRSRLCPDCRRRLTAEAAGSGTGGRNVTDKNNLT